MILGIWKIICFVDLGIDEIVSFNGYVFIFGNGLVFVVNGSVIIYGNWMVIDSNSNDDSLGDLYFNISFFVFN